MESVAKELSPLHREYLWELDLARRQILALADSIPEEAYGWRPAEDARSFSAVLVHIAAANLMLLYRADSVMPVVMEFCGSIEGEGVQQWLAMVHKGLETEKTLTAKSAVRDLLDRSFEAVRESFATTADNELEHLRDLSGEVTTMRRIYLRILVHTGEHMGQAIAYARTMGFQVPWPDPVKVLTEMAAKASS